MFFGKKINAGTSILAPVTGRLIPISKVSDEVFASEKLGKGVAFIPETGKILAPADGTVTVMFKPSCHALVLRLENGSSLMIHVGIDTVMLGGRGFRALVDKGDRVRAGQPLIRFDRKVIADAGYSCEVMLIALDDEESARVRFTAPDSANAGVTPVGEWY